MHIPSWPQAGEREAEMLRSVLDSPQWGGFHPFIAEFETSFAAYQHAAFGIAAFNGTVTLEATLRLLGIGPGDEVIVPAISFVSTATAVSLAGATPVFVDIGEDTFNLEAAVVEAAVSSQTKAVIAVHFGGVMCDMPALAAVCRQRGLHLIEDAAHAHGSEWNGRRAGSFGIAGSFSFQNGKVLSCGEGGILLTSDRSFGDNFRSFVNCGRAPGRSFYEHANLGSNLRMTAFQAAVLLAQFESLPAQITMRARNVKILKERLKDVRQIVWQHIGPEATQCSHYLLTGYVKGAGENRDRFCSALNESGVPCTPFYPHTLFENAFFARHPLRVFDCRIAKARVETGFWLPHRVLLADEQTIHDVALCIEKAAAA